MQFNVTPQAKRNAITFCAVAIGLIALLVFMHLVRDDIPVGICGHGAAAGILLLLGVGKLIEPPVSLISPQIPFATFTEKASGNWIGTM